MEDFATEFEFDLPKGYLDATGTLHKHGVMRLATAADEILPLRDPRVVQNPGYLTIILLSRVITRLGTVPKIDPRVIEAAQDLGANSQQVFRKVIFPLSLPGVLSGVTMVLIPSVSTFVISRLLGGGKSLLLGDLIEMQFLGSAYNPHLGSAISLVMMVIVLVCMGIMNRFGEGEEEAVLL